ncbi:2OG-Fe(II) oxygenase [Pendulispora rubella]|uniref:2OG-Fe(II) oxygenase n=1 Tax=Pendulispora rubella TaxID=2741070 RepID=A0ABZ2KV95_9BACT
MNSDTVLFLRSDVVFRVVGPERVEATVDGVSKPMHITMHKIAIEFAAPRSCRNAYESLEVDGDLHAFERLVHALVADGILQEPVDDTAAGSIETLLRPGLFDDPGVWPRIGREIAQGRAVVIASAFEKGFAERVHTALDRCARWPSQEAAEPFFHYRHHALHDRGQYPPELLECHRIFTSRATRRLMSEVTGSDCAGPARFTAATYLAEDHTLPHTDALNNHAIAYVWHLAKDWKPEWGGHFVWCPSGAIMSPAFNCLVLFKVSSESLHFVSSVSPLARGVRVAVGGWWQSRGEPWQVTHEHLVAGNTQVRRGIYGLPTQTLEAEDANGVVLL